jgi:hypothetical protein
MKQLRGKCLVRKSKTTDGKDVIMLCGSFFPKTEIEITDDEMWVCDIIVSGGIRFSEPNDYSLSPEDFLSGHGQQPQYWKKRSEL